MTAIGITGTLDVALLAEGVDRNKFANGAGAGPSIVALLAEGVDRNVQNEN